MADGFHAEPAELRGYGEMLGRVAGQFKSIEQHARDKGGDTSGFTGLLALLVPVVRGVVGLYGQTLESASEKMTSVRSGLDQTAQGYADHDQANARSLTAAGDGL